MARALTSRGWLNANPPLSFITTSSAMAAAAARRTYASMGQRLAYDLHEPARPRVDERTRPILFLHGLFGAKKNNRGMSKTKLTCLVRALARDLGRFVYALDLRNHGDSPHDPRHDYEAMADDVSEFIRHHGLRDSTIIGHSMGAKTAMTLALRSPSLLSDIVAVDNAPADKVLGRAFPAYVRAMKRIDEAGVTRLADADAILAEVEESLPVRQFLLGNLYREKTPPSLSSSGNSDGGSSSTLKFRIPLDILSKSLDHMGDFPHRDPSAARFKKPALFVRGTRSTYVPDDVLPLVGSFFPRFRLADVDAGHWLISEKPEEFRRAVVEFLEPVE